MKNLSIDQNNPLIKSWFGFFLGLIVVGLSINGLFEAFTLSRVLSTLGFLCFWYPWSQMTHWNNPVKSFFKADDQAMGKLCSYLILIATILLIASVLIRFIN